MRQKYERKCCDDYGIIISIDTIESIDILMKKVEDIVHSITLLPEDKSLIITPVNAIRIQLNMLRNKMYTHIPAPVASTFIAFEISIIQSIIKQLKASQLFILSSDSLNNFKETDLRTADSLRWNTMCVCAWWADNYS